MSAPSTSPVVRVVTVVAVSVVAGVAAVVSFSHMQQLASGAGEGWRSWLIPISIDGLVVAASMVLVTRRRHDLPASPLAWGALIAGAGASLAANIADSAPTVTARLVAGWPAVAFAVAFELLLQQRRAEADPDEDTEATPVVTQAASITPVEVGPALPEPVHPAPGPTAPTPLQQPTPTLVSQPGPQPAGGHEDLVTRVRRLVDNSDARPPGRRSVAKQLGVTEHRARVALDLVTAGHGVSRNGHSQGGSSAPGRSGEH